MIIDFYTTIIDNYGDAGFSFNLAKSLLKEYRNLEIRYFIDDKNLFLKLSGNKKINKLSVFNLKDIKTTPPSKNIFNFFDRKIDFEFLHQFDFEINLINFSYFSLDKNIKNIHNTFYTSKNIKITHFVPSLLSDGGGVIINNKKNLSKTDFFKDKNDVFYNKIWVSVFCYKETFNEIKNEFKKYKDTIFFVFDNKTSGENIVNMPFLTMYNYLDFISVCDKNIVRGENSLVGALVSNKPF
ncbi:elongation factor P maturation arginine rhamnosyltransferase EarP, partial [Candidatus Gracilibacteria bacterium]|nr:elongation factor P maturation arginine rhamnosyltransferase EarP [Candidatus Gracilibacteria bacterium]